MPLEPRVNSLFRRQLCAATRTQLLKEGLSSSAIGEWVRNGRLRPRYRGVYLLDVPVLPELAEEMAALLAAGEGSAISGVSAARIRELPLPATLLAGRFPIELTAPGARRKPRDGLLIRSTPFRSADEVAFRGPLRVTTTARTITDVAARLDDRGLEQLVAHSLRNDLVTRAALELQVERGAHRPGVPRLREVIAGPLRMTRKEAEEGLFRLLADAGLAPPCTNEKVEGRELDAYWPNAKVGIELQSREWHGFEAAMEADVEKAGLFAALGYTVLPLTTRQLREDPELVVARARSALELALGRRSG